MGRNLTSEPLMETLCQCDYVNRLGRLLGLIRITICSCNYTLSTGNVGLYPTATLILDHHQLRWKWSGGKQWTACRRHFGFKENWEDMLNKVQGLCAATISHYGFLMAPLVLTSQSLCSSTARLT